MPLERFLPQKPYNIFFHYLKTIALIILNNQKIIDICLKINAFILAILIRYLNLQHLKNYKYWIK